MVSVVEEKKGNMSYYYLRHNAGTNQLKKYLGKKIPENIDQLKKEFVLEFYRTQWNPKTEIIFENYRKELNPIEKTIKIKNFESFGINFTYHTQKIEGSTLTKEDTKNLLMHGVTPIRKSKTDMIETQNHYELFLRLITSKKLKKITIDTVLSWHKEVFGQTMIGESGLTRFHNVTIAGSENTEFATVPQIKPRLKKLFDWINNYDKSINPVEFACMVHYDFIMIHPFGDGNGRISRLLMNYILFKYDCPLLDIKFPDRIRYFKSLEKSNLQKNSIYFQKWFMLYYIKNNKKYL